MICLFWFSVAKFLSYDNLQFMKREDRGQQIRVMMLHTIILNTPTRRENKAPKKSKCQCNIQMTYLTSNPKSS